MKRLSLLILFAVLLALPALSQQISVESFTPLENDLTANTAGTMKKDQNGKTCALIKVVTSEKDSISTSEYSVSLLQNRKWEKFGYTSLKR